MKFLSEVIDVPRVMVEYIRELPMRATLPPGLPDSPPTILPQKRNADWEQLLTMSTTTTVPATAAKVPATKVPATVTKVPGKVPAKVPATVTKVPTTAEVPIKRNRSQQWMFPCTNSDSVPVSGIGSINAEYHPFTSQPGQMCMHCNARIETLPLHQVRHCDERRRRFFVSNYFCSFNCVLAHTVNTAGGCRTVHQVTLHRALGLTEKCSCAPPRAVLQEFGGCMTRAQFDKFTSSRLLQVPSDTQWKFVYCS